MSIEIKDDGVKLTGEDLELVDRLAKKLGITREEVLHKVVAKGWKDAVDEGKIGSA